MILNIHAKVLRVGVLKVLADRKKPIRRRREELSRDRDTLFDILVEGSKKARLGAMETMERVRTAVSFDYLKAIQQPVKAAVR